MFRKNFDNNTHQQVAAVPDAVPLNTHANLEGARVLVADDERDARAMISQVLQSCGAIVETAHSAEVAVSLAAKSHFDAVVTDLNMPGGDGFSLIRALRLRGKKMPVIALSAMWGPEVEKQVHDAGFAVHVDKPIEVSYLTAAVADVIWNAQNKN